ncbi:uncharacterized protein LOC108027697 isoform X2 [Drosophila biarmipes]|uniref:uncharacterized protein LOC108027697 isoform X2 n=1 Tax=Drosophila biarmipes TaxID=125945 RepID=UPI0021CD08BE|nr:uncharacterized protein LOC108027697 isoform X2 [Drosophila biarmipes]
MRKWHIVILFYLVTRGQGLKNNDSAKLFTNFFKQIDSLSEDLFAHQKSLFIQHQLCTNGSLQEEGDFACIPLNQYYTTGDGKISLMLNCTIGAQTNVIVPLPTNGTYPTLSESFVGNPQIPNLPPCAYPFPKHQAPDFLKYPYTGYPCHPLNPWYPPRNPSVPPLIPPNQGAEFSVLPGFPPYPLPPGNLLPPSPRWPDREVSIPPGSLYPPPTINGWPAPPAPPVWLPTPPRGVPAPPPQGPGQGTGHGPPPQVVYPPGSPIPPQVPPAPPHLIPPQGPGQGPPAQVGYPPGPPIPPPGVPERGIQNSKHFGVDLSSLQNMNILQVFPG